MSIGASSRLTVFVSSTIVECASERAAACRAVESLGYEAIAFESLGARPHPARAVYLGGLRQSQICVAIWKNSYGYIDPNFALEISGIEDEYREARKLTLPILVYVRRDDAARDPRLKQLIDAALPHYKVHFYDDPQELEDQIQSDIRSTVSDVFIEHTSRLSLQLTNPQTLLSEILPSSQEAIDRPDLRAEIDAVSVVNSVSWVIGPSGVGKTVLVAQWALRKDAAYVNARGLSLRQLLGRMVAGLTSSDSVETPISVEDGIEALRLVWNAKARWPLVIDDPMEIAELVGIFDTLKNEFSASKVVVATRDSHRFAEQPAQISIPLLDSEEVETWRKSYAIQKGALAPRPDGTLRPIDVRKVVAASVAPPETIFKEVEGVQQSSRIREMLAFLVRSPEPLSLDDLMQLSASSDARAVEIDEALLSLKSVVVNDGLGYRIVHEELGGDLSNALAARKGLDRFVSLRLGQLFSKTRRHLSAFIVYRPFDSDKALKSAQRAARQMAVEGRLAQSIPALEFVAEYHRENALRFDLAFDLLALHQSYDAAGRPNDAKMALSDARGCAEATNDKELLQVIDDQILVQQVRHQLKPTDLEALREIRKRYKDQGREQEAARLAIEESAILISINDGEGAVPILRDALTTFETTGDRYGAYVAIRNLISSLSMTPEGQPEAEQLLTKLDDIRIGRDRKRERAWICNMQARRYRLDGLVDDALAAASEAIAIGEELGEKNLIALNRIGQGNAQRDKGLLKEALETYKKASVENQAIKRPDSEALACRLAAGVLVDLAEEAVPYQRPGMFAEAENFCTYAIGLLRDSISKINLAEAFDTRGNARLGLGRKNEAFADFAASAKEFASVDGERAAFAIRELLLNIDLSDPVIATELMAACLNGAEELPNADDLFARIIALMKTTLAYSPKGAVGPIFGALIRMTRTACSAGMEFSLWLRLLALADLKGIKSDGRLALLFAAYLAHLRSRDLTRTQLDALAALTLGKAEDVYFQPSREGNVQVSFNLGADKGILVVLSDLDASHCSRFVTLALTAVLYGYRDEINREFFASPTEEATILQIRVLDISSAPEDIKDELNAKAQQSSIAVFMNERPNGNLEMFVACREDAQERCQGDPLEATDLQFMYAEVIRAILHMSLGDQVDEDVLRPKIVKLLRSTIH